MVAPVGVEDADFGHGGVAVLLVVEVALDVLEVGEGHGKAEAVVEFFQLGLGHVLEAVEGDDVGGFVEVVLEGGGLGLVGDAAVDGVDAVLDDLFSRFAR